MLVKGDVMDRLNELSEAVRIEAVTSNTARDRRSGGGRSGGPKGPGENYRMIAFLDMQEN